MGKRILYQIFIFIVEFSGIGIKRPLSRRGVGVYSGWFSVPPAKVQIMESLLTGSGTETLCTLDDFRGLSLVDLERLKILRVAIQSEGQLYPGDATEMHSEVFGRNNLFGSEVELGWVTSAGTFLTRAEAAEWVRLNTPDVHKRLKDGLELESVDYGQAARIPRRKR